MSSRHRYDQLSVEEGSSDSSSGDMRLPRKCTPGQQEKAPVTYNISSFGKPQIRIHSKCLNEVIARVDKYNIPGRSSGDFTEYEPFPTLFYHIDDVRKEIAKSNDEDADLDLEELNRVTADMDPFWRKAREENIETGFISYDMLWRIFRPGELVCHKDAIGSLWLFVLLEIKYTSPKPQRPARRLFDSEGEDLNRSTVLIVWALKWDNLEEQLTRKAFEFTIREFSGQIPISSLPLYPFKYQEASLDEDINGFLARRGQQWWDLIARRTTCLDYHGAAFSHRESVPTTEYGSRRRLFEKDKFTKTKVNGRIIIDFEAKGLWHVGYLGGRESDLAVAEMDPREEYKWDKLSVIAKLTDEQARLCPANIGCHNLSDFKRCIVRVDKLTSAAWNMSAMDHLVLEERKKNMLKGLVGHHYNKQDRDTRGDLVAGKGQSLVILLHGPPGVGKTLTAECVSETVKRPLIALSIGDLVWEEKRLEQRLQEEFNRATDWGAILLLDEADVVLEARSFEDVRRNGIVSVFLRQLEYYQGVLFLTSNRVSTMDMAFQSRIQIGISFKTMTPDIRSRIWDRLLALNGRDKMIGSQAVKEVKEKLAKFQLNGRQIRNVLNVADGLAFNEYEETGKLKYSHIREAVESAVEFQNMLEESKASMKSDQTVWAMYRSGSDEF